MRRLVPSVMKSNPASLFTRQAMTAFPSSRPALTCSQI
jgi:hypothetical protein